MFGGATTEEPTGRLARQGAQFDARALAATNILSQPVRR